MTVTIVARWTTPDIAAATKTTRRAKAFWEKHGVQVRLSQIFTGPHTGQLIVAMVYADMPTYAKVRTAADEDPELQQIQDQIRKEGSLIQEREILVGIDL